MIQRKDKVTHPIHGNGIVENLSNNESIAIVDFKGVMTKCEVSNLQKGVNEFKPKQTPEAIKVLVEIQKLQEMVRNDMKDTDPLQSDFSKGCNAYAKMIDGRIEAILQGAKF